jgi:hypothetical protein
MEVVAINQANRIHPESEEAKKVDQVMQHYQIAFNAAKIASDELVLWAMSFAGIQPGSVIEEWKRTQLPSRVFVPGFTMKGKFPGWKGNQPRMRVEEVFPVMDYGLTRIPQLKIFLKGVPIKDDGEVFRSATCSVTLDVMDHAQALSRDEEGGSADSPSDAMTKMIDEITQQAEVKN